MKLPEPGRLPAFIEPMLAVLVEPFSSADHLFEIKWDGFRSLCFVEDGGARLVGRRKTDFTSRFPELSPLAKLPAGTVLDGEIVLLTAGRPDFQALLARERSWSGSARPSARRHQPVTYVAFDVLYQSFESVMHEPLRARRRRLETLLRVPPGPRVAVSETHPGDGLEFFEKVNEMGLEGVVAKRLDGVYEAGGRSGSWSKFKRRQSVVCVVIGYLLTSTGGLRSLLVAAEFEGQLRFAGQVGTSLPETLHLNFQRKFEKLAQQAPAVACTIRGARWLKPELFCRVEFMEWTNAKKLRMPVFQAML